MRMRRVSKKAKSLHHAITEFVLGKHTIHRHFNDFSRIFLHLIFETDRGDAARVSTEMVIHLLVRFLSGRDNTIGIYHDNKIPAIDMRRKIHLALSGKTLRRLASRGVPKSFPARQSKSVFGYVIPYHSCKEKSVNKFQNSHSGAITLAGRKFYHSRESARPRRKLLEKIRVRKISERHLRNPLFEQSKRRYLSVGSLNTSLCEREDAIDARLDFFRSRFGCPNAPVRHQALDKALHERPPLISIPFKFSSR
jgi:hypothetical protein